MVAAEVVVKVSVVCAPALKVPLAGVTAFCISPATAALLPPGRFAGVAIAARPNQDALLALLEPQAIRLLDLVALQLHAQTAEAARLGQFTPEHCASLVRRAVGVPALGIEVVSALPWRVRAHHAGRAAQRVTGVRARRDGDELQAVLELGRDVLGRVNGEIDAPLTQRMLEL